MRDHTTHRTAYPEQYSHPMVGRLVAVMWQGKEAKRGTIERVIEGSRFGTMAKLDTDADDTFRALAHCVPVEG